MQIFMQYAYNRVEKVLTFWIENLPDDIRKASQTFRISIGLSSFFKTFRVALLPRYSGFCDSGVGWGGFLGITMSHPTFCWVGVGVEVGVGL